MIDMIFGFFIEIITFIVTAVIIVGIILFPLIFKFGWLIYVVVFLCIVASFFDAKGGHYEDK